MKNKFSGVDINTCSLHMLQKIAGLTKARAQAILDTRDSVGYFHNRDQASTMTKLPIYVSKSLYILFLDDKMLKFLALYVKLQTGWKK